ncbi:MAG: hypothetical protein HDQ98_05055 [Lachnospiraceae bacterium]|nr:hypothetical protein [Lachnospiraceae bacterium]
MNPETFFQTIRQKIKPSWATLLISVFLFGLLAHAYAFFNYIPNWDSVISYYSDQNTIHLGRCFLTLACGISSYYDLSWVNGLLSLAYIAVTAILISELLQIRKKSMLILLGALLVTFPAVTSTFGYLYTADGYMLAMLCTTLAIYLTFRHRFGFLPGALLLMFGLGCYQAYITFAAMLVIVYSLDKLLHQDTPLSSLAWKWLRALVCAVIGYALYAVVSRLLLSAQHTTLADYQGVSAINGGGLGGGFAPLTAAKQCLIDFVYFFTGPLHRMNFYSFLNLCLLALLVCGALARIVRKKLWRSPARLCCILLLAMLIPFVCYAIYFLTPDVSYHMLMQGSMYFVYALLLVLYDRAVFDAADKLRRAAESVPSDSSRVMPASAATNKNRMHHGIVWQWLCVIVCSLIVYNFILVANICYRTQETSVSRSMNEIARLADIILSNPALQECGSIAVIGTRDENDAISLNLPPDMTGFSDGYIMTHALHYSLLLDRYHNLSFTPADNEALEALAENAIVRSMPCYPEEGSVQAISGTLVIKLSDES